MANATISHLGVPNAGEFTTAAQRDEMFYKVFAGEVLTAFEETNVFKPLHMVRTIDHGKSAEFPRTWKANARYHDPGTPILGSNNIAINPVVISVDDLLIADVFIYDLEDAKNHFDVRGIFSKQLGDALARSYDQKLARIAIKAARAQANIKDGYGGTVLTNAAANTDGEILASLIFQAAQTLDEKDVPPSERYVVLAPEQYYLLAQTTKVLNKDWNGQGSYAEGSVLKVAGIDIIKSNNLPRTNIAAKVDGEQNDYTGDFTKNVGVVFHKSCMATVQLIGLATEWSGKDFHIMYQGDLCVAKMALGHGYLRPEAAVEIATAAAGGA